MRDPYINLILSLIQDPGKTLKFYLDASKVSRGTFFKVKADLELMGILHWNDSRQITLNQEKGLTYLAGVYPGLSNVFGTMEHGTSVEDQATEKAD
jgi:hypothetical protein